MFTLPNYVMIKLAYTKMYSGCVSIQDLTCLIIFVVVIIGLFVTFLITSITLILALYAT